MGLGLLSLEASRGIGGHFPPLAGRRVVWGRCLGSTLLLVVDVSVMAVPKLVGTGFLLI